MTTKQESQPQNQDSPVAEQPRPNWTIWKERWQALDQTLTELASYYDGLPSDFPRKETLTYLVKHLQAFGKKQFYFFWDGFNYTKQDLNEHKERWRVILDDSDVFQPEYVLQATLDQISHDLEVIQRAANARLPNSPKRMRDTLDIADRLAWKYLQPALKAKLIEQGTTVLTYFQKSPSIRLIPYAPVALIGIPPTAFRTPKPGPETTGDTLVARDLLSTAHEVGHYIYRHGTSNGEPIYRKLDTKLDSGLNGITASVNKWAEEIFADVYGCLSGGAVTALSSQDLALQYYSKTEFIKDDGEHPAPILRPDIYVEALKKKGNRMASSLGSEWEDHRTPDDKIKLKNDEQATISSVHEEVKISDVFTLPVFTSPEVGQESGTNPEKPVNTIISEVLAILKDVELDSSDEVSGVDDLYPNFRAKLVGKETMESPEELKLNREVPEDQLNPWEKWIEKEKFFTFKDGNDNEIPEIPEKGLKKAGYEEDISSKQPPREKNTWIPVAYCAGWSTKIGNHSG